jgi:hypothetical protein
MTRKIVLLLVVLGAGCVSTRIVPVDQTALAHLNGGTVTIIPREKPDFMAMTAGKAAFALIGAAAMLAAGNDIVKKNEVEDPANYIAQHLVADLARENRLRLVTVSELAKSTDAAPLAKQYPNADLLLDVQTVSWSFIYFPTNWSRYRVIYSAKLRLIDRAHGTLLADGFCSRTPDETPDSPTKDELLQDNAARLKKELAANADYCIGQFRSKVLLKT